MKNQAQPDLQELVQAVTAAVQYKKSLRPTQAAEFLGIALSTLWRWLANRPDFPRPRKIGPRVTVFELSELTAWRDAQQQSK